MEINLMLFFEKNSFSRKGNVADLIFISILPWKSEEVWEIGVPNLHNHSKLSVSAGINGNYILSRRSILYIEPVVCHDPKWINIFS